MIICLEGPDGVGKSTLAAALRAPTYHFPTRDLSRFEGHRAYGFANLADMFNFQRKNPDLWESPDLIVFDRFYPSTFVYNFDGNPVIPTSHLPRVDLFIHVTAPYHTYPASKGELTKQEFDDKVEKYTRYFAQIDVPTITFDSTKDDPSCLLQDLLTVRSR